MDEYVQCAHCDGSAHEMYMDLCPACEQLVCDECWEASDAQNCRHWSEVDQDYIIGDAGAQPKC